MKLSEKNATGCIFLSSPSWFRTATIANPDASTSISNGVFSHGHCNTGASLILALSSSNTFCLAFVHSHGVSFFVRSLRGHAIAENPRMK